MKFLNLKPSPVRTVDYFGLEVQLIRGERFLAHDEDGELWAYYREPLLRTIDIERGQWGIGRTDALPRSIGRVSADEVNWQSSIVDYGDDAE